MDNGEIVKFKTWIDSKKPGSVIVELENECLFEVKLELTSVMFNSYDESNGLPIYQFATQNVIKTLRIPKEVRKKMVNKKEENSSLYK